ncbi:hypothetical protein MTR_1g014550 [Medicago truncatula]|uniref:Uncharacterized protein n=1 Tax=Medicago truncatula TaxID=3880 RepID=A0A072VDM9_MEDTR|nr:hypothetical protein MTR_1g014550 [Medicago truncatula]
MVQSVGRLRVNMRIKLSSDNGCGYGHLGAHKVCGRLLKIFKRGNGNVYYSTLFIGYPLSSLNDGVQIP